MIEVSVKKRYQRFARQWGSEPREKIMFNEWLAQIASDISLSFVKLFDTFRALGPIDESRDTKEATISDYRDHI